MAVVKTGKPARTHYRVVERFVDCTLVRCALETEPHAPDTRPYDVFRFILLMVLPPAAVEYLQPSVAGGLIICKIYFYYSQIS